jgi:hypothetical protein
MIDDLIEEIQNVLPIDLGDIIPPYPLDITLENKFKVAYQALRRSIKLRNRSLSLVNTFYLGKTLNEFETSTQKFLHKRKLTTHYAVMAEYTFDIFEVNPTLLLHMTLFTVQRIKKLNRTQALALREAVERTIYT